MSYKNLANHWSFFIFLISFHITAQVQVKHYTTTDGLPHDFTFQMHQDDDGYLWIGTDDGLAKFNGRNFTTFDQSDGFRSNFVIDMKKYSKDTLALAVWKGGLHFMRKDSIFTPEIKNDETSRIGNAYVLGKDIFSTSRLSHYVLYEKTKGLKFNKKKLDLYVDEQGRPSFTRTNNATPTYSATTMVDNNLYFHRESYVRSLPKRLKGIYKYEPKKKLTLVFPFLKDLYVNSFGKYGNNSYYATVKDTFYIFDENHIIDTKIHDFNQNTIRKYAKTKHFEVFVVNDTKSGNDSIYTYDVKNDHWDNLSETMASSFLASDLFVDKDENVWITSSANGLLKLSHSTKIIKETLFESDYIMDISIGFDGTLFFLKNKCIYGYDTKTKKAVSKSLDFHLSKFLQSFLTSKNIPISLLEENANNQTILGYKLYNPDSLVIQKEGNTNRFLSECPLEKRPKHLQFLDIKVSTNDTTIVRDELWAASNKGIIVYDLDSLKYKRTINTKSGLTKTYVKKILHIPNQGTWAVSSNGISLIKPNGDIVHYGEKDGLLSSKINAILSDHRGTLWLATQKGFSILREGTFYNFGASEGFRSSFASQIIEDHNHQIWIAGNKGVARIDNNTPFIPTSPPNLVINKQQDNIAINTIDYSEKNVTVQYKYDSNKNWSTIESNRMDISNYAPGEHQLQFRTKNAISDWGYSKIQKFTISKIWYEKLGFIISMSILGVITTTSLVYFRLVQVSKRNTKLRNTINKLTQLESELSTVRENVAQDFHDELGNKLAGITILSDLMMADENLQHSKSINMVSQIQKDAKDLYFGIKDFVWSIDSKSDNLQELLVYLVDFGEDLFQYKNIVFKTKVNILEKDVRLPYYWSRQLLLLFKEAMTNSLKHADASTVTLELSIMDNILSIKFSDDGKGFDMDKIKRKNGLLNLQKRATKINGSLTISSNNGTIVEFKGKLTQEFFFSSKFT